MASYHGRKRIPSLQLASTPRPSPPQRTSRFGRRSARHRRPTEPRRTHPSATHLPLLLQPLLLLPAVPLQPRHGPELPPPSPRATLRARRRRRLDVASTGATTPSFSRSTCRQLTRARRRSRAERRVRRSSRPARRGIDNWGVRFRAVYVQVPVDRRHTVREIPSRKALCMP